VSGVAVPLGGNSGPVGDGAWFLPGSGAAGRWRWADSHPLKGSRRLWDGCGFAAPLSFGESGENGEQAGGLRILFA